jgi:1-acyl-sn-glycerol-3-phosphate acyltransferase
VIAYRLARAVAQPLARVLWRLEVSGAEHMPPGPGPVIVAANHDSLLDPVFLSCALRRPLRYLAKEELFTGPAAPLLRSLGGIPVARGRGDREAVAAGLQALRRGAAVAVFPQGTVLGEEGRPWHRGAARLALAAGAPILPVRLVDTERALQPLTRRIGFPRVRVYVGKPIPVERAEATVASAKALTERVRTVVEALE